MDSKTLVTAPPKEAEIGPLAKTVGGKGGPGGSQACHHQTRKCHHHKGIEGLMCMCILSILFTV